MKEKNKVLMTDVDQSISEQEIIEHTLIDFDKSIVDLGISLANTATKNSNPEYKLKLIDAVVKLRGALPPFYAVNKRG